MSDNTFAAALTTDFLMEGVVVPLQSRLAPLNAFVKQYEPDPVKPLATVQIKRATVAGTTQVDPTDFTTGGDSTLAAGAVALQHARFRLVADQLRDAIGVQQESAHISMSRPASRSRSKSRSTPTRGDWRKNCTRFFG